MKNRISIYGAGGAGANILRFMTKEGIRADDGFAYSDVYYVDTSRSNIPADVPEERVFIYRDPSNQDLKGNGKVRKSNYNILGDNSVTNGILHKFHPGALNIVINSCGGGTGSIVGPLLTKALIEKGENVVVVTVGSMSSMMDASNTLACLKTYDSIASLTKTPISMVYLENEPGQSHAEINAIAYRYVLLLTTFFSNEHEGIDNSDLKNFLDFTKVTSYPPRLSSLNFYKKNITPPDGSVPISAITLDATSVEAKHNIILEYQVSGVANPNTPKFNDEEIVPLHMVTMANYFPGVVAKLEEFVRQFEEKSKRSGSKDIMGNSSADVSGIVF